MTDATIVCILGMHRSGTSVLSRLLNILGVDLGPEESLLQPHADNPKGFWEHGLIQNLNDEILRSAGGSWHEPPEFSDHWELSADLRNFRMRARRIIRDQFAKSALWGWKDPRTCLTLPFWQHLLPPLSYVVCLRHPMDVADSLQHRNGFSIEKGIYLWLLYNKAILLNTRRDSRLVVLYERLVTDTQVETERLSKQLGMAERANQGWVKDEVNAFVDRELRHHGRRQPRVLADSDSSRLSRALMIAGDIYNHFMDRSHSEPGVLTDQLESAAGLLRPVINHQNIEWKRREEQKWAQNESRFKQDLNAAIPAGSSLILVDEACLGVNRNTTDYRVLPFPECEGVYGGRPQSDEIAIGELQRLQRQGAGYMVFAWPTFWWLEHYSAFHRYLRARCQCLLENDYLVIFKLDTK